MKNEDANEVNSPNLMNIFFMKMNLTKKELGVKIENSFP